MQRVSSRAFLLTAATVGSLVASLLVVFMLSMGAHNTPKAQAVVPTPTATLGPSPTPKTVNNGLAATGGLFDLDAGPGVYKCMTHVETSNATATPIYSKSATVCYAEGNIGLGSSEPPCAAWHGPGPQGAGVGSPSVPGEGSCPGGGPLPAQGVNKQGSPPPYIPLPPEKGTGFYCPLSATGGCGSIPGTNPPIPIVADESYQITCFADIGTSLGPNVVSIATTQNATAHNPAIGSAYPTADTNSPLWLARTNAECTAAVNGTAPTGAPTVASLPLIITRRDPARVYCSIAGNCPITTSASDPCTDFIRLWTDKAGSSTKCPQDPFNPFAPEGASPNVSGPWDLNAEVKRVDVGIPGEYRTCIMDIQQNVKALTGKILCVTDSPTITVNAAAAGADTCPPADAAHFCGDGSPGSPPPGCAAGASCPAQAGQGASGCAPGPPVPCDVSYIQFAHIDGTKESTLTGVVDNTKNAIEASWCIQNSGGQGNDIYVIQVNAHTGQGFGLLYQNQDIANCKTAPGTPPTPAGTPKTMGTTMVRQSPGGKTAGACAPNAGVGYTGCRDSTGSGCPDKLKLSDNKNAGGLRDPLNRWDWFNPEKLNTPHTQTVADILQVVGQYGKDQGNAAYTIDTDRTAIPGGNAWSLGPPDGKQTVADILAAVNQFGQNCNSTV